jgi:hypothetical protein
MPKDNLIDTKPVDLAKILQDYHDFLKKLNEKTDIINIQANMTTNRLRRVIESLYALACEYTIGKHITSSYDGLYSDGVIHNNMISKHLYKICFDRQ